MYPAAMDVERTIEFILKSQARAESRMDGIAKLIRQGMRMLVRTDTRLAELTQAQKRTEVALAESARHTDARFGELAQHMDAGFAELRQAQKATEKSLKAFIDSLRHGRNGRTNR